jgi:transposase InsO family protein
VWDPSDRLQQTAVVPPVDPFQGGELELVEADYEPLAVVLDAWSRRVVGWALAGHVRTALVLDAFEMAVRQRKAAEPMLPPELITRRAFTGGLGAAFSAVLPSDIALRKSWYGDHRN